MPWWSTSMIFIASVIFIGNDTCYTRRTVKILHASSLISTVQWQVYFLNIDPIPSTPFIIAITQQELS